jgi:hypothetical protein
MPRSLIVALLTLLTLTGCNMSEAELDQFVDKMLTPTGAAVVGWDSKGLDWRTTMVIEGQPQIFFDNDKAMPGLTLFGSAAPPPPQGWVEHSRIVIGTPPGTQRQTDLVRMGPDLLISFSVDYRLRGNALCIPAGSGAELALMRPAGKAAEPANADEAGVRYAVERYQSKFFANELCVTLRQTPKGYKLTYFTGDGQPLGQLTRGNGQITRHGADSAETLLGITG